jgi:hypothetical protein
MILKIIALVAAAIPIFLFIRAVFFRRPGRVNEAFVEFKKQANLAFTAFMVFVGCVVLYAIGKLIWPWL